MRPKCTVCDRLARSSGFYKGKEVWAKLCGQCHDLKYCPNRKRKRKAHGITKLFRKVKKENCEICGFIPVNSCQLDIHHQDENKKNNSLNNLQTLCANCHRLIHFMRIINPHF